MKPVEPPQEQRHDHKDRVEPSPRTRHGHKDKGEHSRGPRQYHKDRVKPYQRPRHGRRGEPAEPPSRSCVEGAEAPQGPSGSGLGDRVKPIKESQLQLDDIPPELLHKHQENMMTKLGWQVRLVGVYLVH